MGSEIDDRALGWRAALWVAAPLLQLACGTPASESAVDVEVPGAWGVLTFDVRSEEPVDEGANELEVTVLRDGEAAGDVALSAVVEMRGMTHGSTDLEVRRAGEGRFTVEVDLAMPGEWLLWLEANRSGEAVDGCSLELEVR